MKRDIQGTLVKCSITSETYQAYSKFDKSGTYTCSI